MVAVSRQNRWRRRCINLSLIVLAVARGYGAEVSVLSSRGYTVLPEPQQVELKGGDFEFGPKCRLQLDRGVKASDTAVESLKEGLLGRWGVQLEDQRGTPSCKISLVVQSGSVAIGAATDKDRMALADQAYRLELSSDQIRIVANTNTGLFYGVDTLLQLVKRSQGTLWLPTGRITDWPDLQLRFILWDDRHHVDRVDALKKALREAAAYKINGFAIMLNGHFEYASAPAVVTPYALSAKDLQDLTDYGLRYHVQLIPYIDGPAHLAFILKHPEYKKLRAFPESNYELCVTNAASYKLLEGMYQDLLDANKGGKYFVISTDEPYYVGLADNTQCNEVDRAKQLGSRGKLLAEFLTQTGGYLHERGRQVIMWAGYPMVPGDISSLPSYFIDRGINYNPASTVQVPSHVPLDLPQALKAHGIRGMIRTAPEGSEPLFPSYYLLPPSDLFNPVRIQDQAGAGARSELVKTYQQVSSRWAREESNLVGVFDMGWDDSGLHPETFWLGYITGGGWAWRPGSPGPAEAANSFFRLFYGAGVTDMARVYQLMSTEAQFWNSSWDRQPSTSREPMFGNPHQIYDVRRPAHDQTLQLPPVPQGKYLLLPFDWTQENLQRVKMAQDNMPLNQELLGLLYQNLSSTQFHHYNLEVFLSIAGLYHQNLQMIQEMDEISRALEAAQAAAAEVQFKTAVVDLDRALDIAKNIRDQRNEALDTATVTWYKSWYPRVEEANGRRFLYEGGDVDDMLADRTIDMSYLVYREMTLPLGGWFDQVEKVRNEYAQSHNLATRADKLDWKETQWSGSQD